MNNSKDIYYGQSPLVTRDEGIRGGITELEGEAFYRISDYDRMPPFFMSVVSSSDHWMFISATGGLTCGRKDPENALFPYDTDDKIHDAFSITGSRSILLVEREGRCSLWEPFRTDLPGVYETTRNLYKNRAGNKLIFEEINHSLGLSFRYAWMNSDRFGFVKQSEISNTGMAKEVSVRFIDGIRNILPYGVNRMLQANMSTLIDGYKKCELDEGTGLGIYTLSSILTDRAEPSEALKATTVWAAGLENPKYLLSDDQFPAFLKGSIPETESSLKGRRGAYFVYGELELDPGQARDWLIVADINQGPSDVPSTINMLRKGGDLKALVLDDVIRGTGFLKELVMLADGEQMSADGLTTARHFSNTLFNIMRGGVFPRDYLVDTPDLKEFFRKWNSGLFERLRGFLENLELSVHYQDLLEAARETGDPDLTRLVYEYLPLTFSRRHGDPSRPWNQFSIDVKKPDGSRKLYYQGNWRDIFQNWEALAISYPGFTESFISKFVNASTVDGYNPYRVTRDGIDWEILDPDDPWSNIGYWGDHQVIYLLRLLELSMKYHPGELTRLLSENLFVYANVPYRIRPYDELVADASNSIEYDADLEEIIAGRVAASGADGKLLFDSAGEVLKTNLAEKILITLLSKLSNFVPEGGIWMNTQRPEWNDANNALVGNGLSMVTLYYLRRFLEKIDELFGSMKGPILIAEEVEELLQAVWNVFREGTGLLSGSISDTARRGIVDLMGTAGSNYRNSIYDKGFSETKREITASRLKEFISLSLEFLDHSIASSRRFDNLFHSYNLLEFGEDTLTITPLYEMLEGQVAVLGSGYLDAEEALQVLDALRESKMYRPDQNSYTLYPDGQLPGFLEKNIIPAEALGRSAFLVNELESGRREIIEEDADGNAHFNGSLRNAAELKERLDGMGDISPREKEEVCNLFINCFNHRKFTGRSGTFYKYEGLGCIYWHMVSKLLLAVQEVYLKSEQKGVDPEVLSRLKDHYDQIKDGLGLKKSPGAYGAFPTDPYSHTPGFSGVQQPGMTGQVKEDVIIRFGELGVLIKEGSVSFEPLLLQEQEYLQSGYDWQLNGRVIRLEEGELGFTLCGTPVIYRLGKSASTLVELSGGEEITLSHPGMLDKELSFHLFNRTGHIKCIRVEFPGS
ncbi:MAG: hypothetical protein GY790_13445 [Bacteroidetes bacterium]|nr:hypothetical protein [Bacteroidota bacterium]